MWRRRPPGPPTLGSKYTPLPIRESGRGEDLLIHGAGLRGLREPADVLHCAGSGTTIRLLAGLLAGQPFTSVLTGTDPLRRRPMGRIAEPLRQMGATILGRDGGRLAPLTIRGGNLRGIDYAMPVASAQVKSAILLAGLFAEGETVVHEPGPSRDHTERMLARFEVEVKVEAEGRGAAVRVIGGQRLIGGGTLTIPGDFSSAAFPLVAAAIVPGSDVRLTGVGVNPTRTGLYDLLAAMGAQVRISEAANQRISDPRTVHRASNVGEPIADLTVRNSPLRATEAYGDLIVRAIDEFPIFAVAATQAEGTTVIREAEELRVKESDRIASVATELRKMGARIEERPDGMLIHGPTRLTRRGRRVSPRPPAGHGAGRRRPGGGRADRSPRRGGDRRLVPRLRRDDAGVGRGYCVGGRERIANQRISESANVSE